MFNFSYFTNVNLIVLLVQRCIALLLLLVAANLHAQTSENYRKAHATLARVEQTGNYTENISYADLNTLPIGLKQTVSNVEVTIAVSDARWETTH
jgi:hypothetical protein